MRKTINVVAGLAWRYNHRTGVEVLLGRRKDGKLRGGLWEMPGGKVDPDEDVREALSREWREELGVDVTAEAEISTAILRLDDTLVVELRPVVEVRPGEFDRAQALDHAELRWVRLDDAMRYLPCSPALYAHYRDAADYLLEHAENQW